MKLHYEEIAEETIEQVIKSHGFFLMLFESGDYCLQEFGAYPCGTAYFEDSEREDIPKCLEEQIFDWSFVQ